MEYGRRPMLGAGDASPPDLQCDFMPGGTFGVPEGEDVIAPLISLIQASVAQAPRSWRLVTTIERPRGFSNSAA